MALYVDIDVINLYTRITTPQDVEMMVEGDRRKIERLRGEIQQGR